MNIKVNQNELELMVGDITKQSTDAIVNAANGTLLGGGGVDGAIHKAAGKELLEACRTIRQDELDGEKLQTGQAVITKGFQLPADYVIHTVGPVWENDTKGESELLAQCYDHSLHLALENELTSISFPSISTGVYHFPIDQAANIALETIIDFLKHHSFGKVVLTLFSKEDYQVYAKALEALS